MSGLNLPGVQSNFAGKANTHMQGAVNAYRGQQPKQTTTIEPPDPTIGGAIGAGAGGAAAGFALGGPMGAGIGAAAMGISYLLS